MGFQLFNSGNFIDKAHMQLKFFSLFSSLLEEECALVLGRTQFGSRFGQVFGGSVGSRFSFDEKASKKSSIFAILLSKVRGSVWFLGGLVGSRFGSQEQTGGSVGSWFGFWRFGRFEVRYFQVRPNTSRERKIS